MADVIDETVSDHITEMDSDAVFEAQRLQIEAWSRAHIGLKCKWWLFGMPQTDELRAWVQARTSPFSPAEEARIREIVSEEYTR